MITIFFIVTTVIALIKWLCYWIGSTALIKYMKDKGYTLPSNDEMKAYCAYVLKKTLHIR